MPKTDEAVMERARKELQQAAQYKPTLRKTYVAENRVPIYLSPMYRPYFGNNMRVAINGIPIYMPVDGATYMVPQSYADEITRRRMAIDTMLTKQNRMVAVAENLERAPGELSVF